MLGTRAERQSRFECKALGVFEPGAVVFEGGALTAFMRACPQPPHQGRGAAQIDIDQSFLAHHSPACGLWRGNRIRLGRCSSSRARPTPSIRASANSSSRTTMPSTNNTVAYAPMETPGSPFSILPSVIRLTPAAPRSVPSESGGAGGHPGYPAPVYEEPA